VIDAEPSSPRRAILHNCGKRSWGAARRRAGALVKLLYLQEFTEAEGRLWCGGGDCWTGAAEFADLATLWMINGILRLAWSGR